ncbi:hypothetical protein Tco_0998576 [Tanacetum coccineum]
MDTGGSPRRQDTIGGAPAQTRSERVLEKPNEPPLSEGYTSGSGEGSMQYHFELTDNVPPTPYASPLSRGNTLGSDEGRMELIKELMETCTSLTKRVLALEEAKTAQDRRRLFKGIVKTSTDTSLGEDASKQGRSSDKTKPMFKDSDFYVLDVEQITTTGPSHVSTVDQFDEFKPRIAFDALFSVKLQQERERSLTLKKSTIFSRDQSEYTRQQKRNQDFIPMDSEKEVQESGKRLKRVAGSYATQKSPKKPKVMKSVKNVTEEEAAEYKRGEGQISDLRMIFDPDEKDELWMNQLDWKLLKWKLHENCGVHTLFIDGTPMEINMRVEKKYPLIKELLEKVLNLQLEVEEESTVTAMT